MGIGDKESSIFMQERKVSTRYVGLAMAHSTANMNMAHVVQPNEFA